MADKYGDDRREMCKYGADCYQKNPAHHKRFKHLKKKSPHGDDGNPNDLKNVEENCDENTVKKTNSEENRNTNDFKRPKNVEENCDRNTAKKPKTEENCDANAIKRPKKEEENYPVKQIIKKSEPENVTCLGTTASVEPFNINYSNVPEEFKKEILVDSLDTDVKSRMKFIFGVEMPDDFYSFFSFCESLSVSSPSTALSSIGIQLVGPYDLLCKKIQKCTKAEAVLHYRYYYDPPEFQTVLTTKTKSHVGYFRDDPNELPVFVASNEEDNGCIIKPLASNIFATTNIILEKAIKSASPFARMKISSIQKSLHNWCKINSFSLDNRKNVKRAKQVVAKTFHNAGIVVPYNKSTTVGYRELISEKDLIDILTKIVSTATIPIEKSPQWYRLHDLVTYAIIANDECDFGASLELGINLLCFGNDIFNKVAVMLLTKAYNLLNRELFSTIAQIHLCNRRKGPNVQAIV